MWWWMTAALACDHAALSKVFEALELVDDRYLPDVAAAGFGESCTGPVAEQARRWIMMEPELRRLVEAEAVLAAPALWVEVCPAGLSAVAATASMTPDAGRAWLYDTCELARWGWVSREDWMEAEAAWLPWLAGVHLGREGVDAAHVRAFVRAWLRPKPPPEPDGDGLLPYLQLPTLELPPDDEAPYPDEMGGSDSGLWVGREIPMELPDLAFEAAPDLTAGGAVGGVEGGAVGGVMGGMIGFREGPPAALSLAQPRWSARALAAGGACRVQVHVREDGSISGMDLGSCPAPLRRGARDATRRSTFAAGWHLGMAVGGLVELVFVVDR